MRFTPHGQGMMAVGSWFLRLVDVSTAACAGIPLHLLLVVNVGIRNAHALSTLYVLARRVDFCAKELAEKLFHIDIIMMLRAYSLKDFRLLPIYCLNTSL